MTTESTTATIGEQSAAIRVLSELIAQNPELPSAYTTIHQPSSRWLAISLNVLTPTAFNRWMAVLGIEAAAVYLHPNARGSWLEASSKRDGVQITLSTHGILLTEDMLNAPRGSEVTA